MNRPRWIGTLLVAAAVTAATPALALADDGTDKGITLIDWDHPWSLLKWFLLAGVAVVSWLCCFHLLFPSRIAAPAAGSRWPLDVFGESAAGFVLLVTVGFLVVFARLSPDALGPVQVFPGPKSSALNRNFLWVCAAVGGVVIATITKTLVFRHRGS